MTHKVDDVGMHIFEDFRGRTILKYSPNSDTVWPGKAMGYDKGQITDLYDAMAEVMQLRIIAGLVDDNPAFIKAVTDEPQESERSDTVQGTPVHTNERDNAS